MNREVLKVSVGSVNYNLNDEYSDVDYKVFVLPTFIDLYRSKSVSIANEDYLGNDYDIKDIRYIPKALHNTSINYAEVLFAKIFEPIYSINGVKEYIDYLITNKEELVKINLPYLFSSSIGVSLTQQKIIKKGRQSTKYLFEKYNYDTKAFMSSYRVLDFLNRYYHNDFTDFLSAFRYNDKEREDMLKLKNGFYTLEECEKILAEKLEQTRKLEPFYNSFNVNEELFNELEKRTMDLIYKNI